MNLSMERDGVDRMKPFQQEIVSVRNMEAALARFKDDKVVCLDYETSGLQPYNDNFRLAGIALADEQGERGVYIHANSLGSEDLSRENLKTELGMLADFLVSRDKVLVYNAKYELAVTLSQMGVELNNVVDVMMMLRTVDRGGSLKDCAVREGVVEERWDADLDKWNDGIKKLSSHLKWNSRENMWLQNDSDRGLFDLLEFYKLTNATNNRKEVMKAAKHRLGINKNPSPFYEPGELTKEEAEFIVKRRLVDENLLFDELKRGTEQD